MLLLFPPFISFFEREAKKSKVIFVPRSTSFMKKKQGLVPHFFILQNKQTHFFKSVRLLCVFHQERMDKLAFLPQIVYNYNDRHNLFRGEVIEEIQC